MKFVDVVARGVAVQALHEKGIVHRDLKPQNVLLTAGGQAKVSDMGLSKTLPQHVSSFVSNGGFGSSGWQAPEQIRTLTSSGDSSSRGREAAGRVGSSDGPAAPAAPARQSKAVDIFSLGLVLFWTLTRGAHPFGGDRFARDGNILRKDPDLTAVAHDPELENLLRAMLHRCGAPPLCMHVAATQRAHSSLPRAVPRGG